MARTLRELAEHLNLSISTTSNALKEKPTVYVSRATRERVRHAAAELGYRPNVVARSLVRGKTQALGFLITNLTNPVFGEVAETLHRAARERGYDLLIALDDGSEELETQQVNRLIDRRVDGLLLWGGHTPGAAGCIARLRQQQLPYVVIGTPEADPASSFVAADRAAGIAAAVDHLAEQGITRMAYAGIDVGLANPLQPNKYQGFLIALRRHGLDPAQCLRLPAPGPAPRDARAVGYQVGRELAGSPERPQALLCMTDVIALGALAGLRDGGIAVPREMAVVGYDGIAEGEFSHPRLTTLGQPLTEMVERGLTALLHRIDVPDAAPERILLTPRLIVRESCGAKPALDRVESSLERKVS